MDCANTSRRVRTRLDNRHRDKDGEISRKHGNTLVRTLRKIYGAAFAPGFQDATRLSDVLKTLDEPSLNLRTALEAYDHSGSKNPSWDDLAREGIRMFVTPGVDQRKLFDVLSRLVEVKGCTDPLIRYFYARTAEKFAEEAKVKLAFQTASDAMLKSNYPPVRKELAVLRCFEYGFQAAKSRFQPGQPMPADFKEWLNTTTTQFMELWPEVAAQKDAHEHQLQDIATRIIDIEISTEMDRKRFYDWVQPPLEKAFPATSCVPLEVKAEFYIRYAWDARGGGFANTVPPEAWKLFHDRLALAQDALEQAWKLDQSRASIPRQMLVLAMAEAWPLEQMEIWFDRAMKINPDDLEACNNKLNYLEPKWNGSPQNLIAFGHECLETRNWAGGVPFLMITAHQRLSNYAPDPEAYWQIPVVWDDIQSVLIPYVKALPQNHHARSQLCYWACRTGHWEEAARQFKLLGTNATASTFGGAAGLERYRRQTAEKVKTR
jgi:hypothetical protein